MSEITYTLIPLNRLFTVGRGLPKYTKSYADEHKGTYPVYSSKTENDGVFAYINTYDYDGEYLTWSTDGYAGLPAYRTGKFSCTDHCGVLTLNDEYKDIYLPYVRWQIDFRKLRLGYGNQRVKVNQVKNSSIEIKIPLDSEGNYDYQKQKELAEIYNQINEQRLNLLAKSYELKEISVVLPQDDSVKWDNILPIELFTPQNGNSDYTKEYCKKRSGTYPLYSGNTDGSFESIDTYDYDGEYLTWAKDGLAGYLMLHNEKFSLTGHRGILLPTEKCKNIDLKYIKYVLEPVFRANKKGREGDLGKNEYTTLNSDMIKKIKDTIPIPVKEDGTYDIDKQIELSAKYEQIESIINELSNRITELTNIIIV